MGIRVPCTPVPLGSHSLISMLFLFSVDQIAFNPDNFRQFAGIQGAWREVCPTPKVFSRADQRSARGAFRHIPLPAIPTVINMLKSQRLNSLILIAFGAALPVVAQAPLTKGVRVQPPYTAEFKTTRVETLANGATITNETKEVMARDSQLRRFTATTNAPTGDRPAMTLYRVSDPTTGDEITWNTSSKVAHVVRRPVGDQRHGCWATPDGRNRASYGGGNGNLGVTMLEVPAPPADRAAPVASPLGSNNVTHFPTVASGPDGQDVTMIGVRHAPGEPVPAPVERDMTREDLGADTILGVEVRGTRTTTTTPAGAQGNDEPLISTNETWIAPSLGMVLRSVSDDPRMGKTNRELVSLDLNNPDPALFELPSGYTVETEVMQPVACSQ